MVKSNVVYDDLREIAGVTGSEFFLLDEIYKTSADDSGVYNVDLILERTRDLLGPNNKQILVDSGILYRGENGAYEVNPGASTEGGGGINYSIDDKSVFFFFGNESLYEKHIEYHEAAHSIQSTLNLFEDHKLNMAREFCKKGIKEHTGGGVEAMFANTYAYSHYLKESHSDAFETACLYIRSENAFDRLKNVLTTYLVSSNQMNNAMASDDKEYPSMKYYASFPAEKAALKRMRQLRKSGES